MAEDVIPTRSELIELKKRITLAEKGHQILERKRDGLVFEFRTMLEEAKRLRDELVSAFRGARESFQLALAAEGDMPLRSLAIAMCKDPAFTLDAQSIMGVVIPKVNITRKFTLTDLEERKYGIIGVNPLINDVVDGYERLLGHIVKTAEVETGLRRLIEEIEKTNRRVNALHYKVIPELRNSARYIQSHLEELERENIFRLKRIKN